MENHPDLPSFWFEKIARVESSGLAWSVSRHKKATIQILDELTQLYVPVIGQTWDESDISVENQILQTTIHHTKGFLESLLQIPLLSLQSQKQILAAFKKLYFYQRSLEEMTKSPFPEVQAFAAARILTENQ